MGTFIRSSLCSVSLLAAPLFSSAGAFAQEKPSFGPTDASKPMTVDGTETAELRALVRGTLLTTEPLGGLVRLDLPDGKKSQFREAKRDQPIIESVSSLDREGNLLVVMSQKDDATLGLERADGRPGREIARGHNGLGFQRTFVGPCLAPSGIHGLVLRDPHAVYMNAEPRTTFKEGKAEVWDLAAGKKVDFEMTALVGSASWFPDGKSFCIAALVSPEGIPVGAFEDYNQQTIGRRTSLVPVADRRVPAAFHVKLDGGTKTLLQIGRRCVVSTDGASILIQGIGTEWMKRDVKSGKFQRVRWPGVFHDRDHPVRRLSTYEGGPLAFIESDLVVYWGLPTTGAETGVTKNNSPLVGEKPMLTIKAARLSDGRFVTLVPSIDPRRKVSFSASAAR